MSRVPKNPPQKRRFFRGGWWLGGWPPVAGWLIGGQWLATAHQPPATMGSTTKLLATNVAGGCWLVVGGWWQVAGGWWLVVTLSQYQLSAFFQKRNCTWLFQNGSGFQYQDEICAKLKVSKPPGTFLQNQVKKHLCECRCGCGYVFQISMEVVVFGKISNRTLGSGITRGNNVDSDIFP